MDAFASVSAEVDAKQSEGCPFFRSFLSSGTKWPTVPLALSPEGGICVTYRFNPPTVTRDSGPLPGPFRGHFRSSRREPARDRKWVSEGTSKGTENGLLKGPKTRISKADSKGLSSEKLCNIAPHRFVSRRIASRRANVR